MCTYSLFHPSPLLLRASPFSSSHTSAAGLYPTAWKDQEKVFKRKSPWLSSQECCPFLYGHVFTPTLLSPLHLSWLLLDTECHPIAQTRVLQGLPLLLLPSWPVQFDQQSLTKLPFSLPYPYSSGSLEFLCWPSLASAIGDDLSGMTSFVSHQHLEYSLQGQWLPVNP